MPIDTREWSSRNAVRARYASNWNHGVHRAVSVRAADPIWDNRPALLYWPAEAEPDVTNRPLTDDQLRQSRPRWSQQKSLLLVGVINWPVEFRVRRIQQTLRWTTPGLVVGALRWASLRGAAR